MNIGFVSLGCSKNLVDAEIMIGLVQRAGFNVVDDPGAAEIIIVNTCGFIESAKEESINTILEMAGHKNGKCKKLIVTGCLAQRYASEILKEMPEVDAVVGVHSFNEILNVIARVDGERFALCAGANISDFEGLPRTLTTPPYTAYLKIAEGCSNRCTYCAIPEIRGPYQSRKEESILKEARELSSRGVRELVVIAQDTTRYGLDLGAGAALAPLLKKLCAIPKIKWVRVLYCYPEAITDELLEVIRSEEKIVKYLDIPIQHINNGILKKMGRRSSGDEIRALIEKARLHIPGLTLRTSLIAGFPGEGEGEFKELCGFVENVRFDRLGVFAYSKEEGTPAAKMSGQVSAKIKERRRARLMSIQREIAMELAKEKIGSVITVLTEGRRGDFYVGRSGADAPEVDPVVLFKAPRALPSGEFVRVLVTGADEYDLIGEIYGEYPE